MQTLRFKELETEEKRSKEKVMKDFILLLRPLNCFMAGLAVVFSLWLGNVSGLEIYFLAFASVFLICAAGMLINDYFDMEIDRVNRPEKWRVVKRYSNVLLPVSAALFGLGLVCSVFLNTGAFLLALANSAILVLYPWKLKKIIFLKNVTIAYLVGSVFLYGGIISNHPAPVVFSIIAFVSNMGREIIKDVADIEGDKKAGIKTLATVLGKLSASAFSITFTLSSILLAPLPYLLGIFGEVYLMLIFPSILGFAYTCAISLVSAKSAAKWSKISMLLALLAFIGAKVF